MWGGGGLGVYLPYFSAAHVTALDNDKETLDRLDHDDKLLADATALPFTEESRKTIGLRDFLMNNSLAVTETGLAFHVIISGRGAYP